MLICESNFAEKLQFNRRIVEPILHNFFCVFQKKRNPSIPVDLGADFAAKLMTSDYFR